MGLVTVLCAVAFLKFFDVSHVARTIVSSDRKSVLVGALLAVVTINLRAMRLSLCVKGRAISPLVPVAYVSNALSALLPAKLGEAALPLLLKRYASTSIGAGVGVLVLIRVFDLLSLGVVGSVGVTVALWPSERLLSQTALLVAVCSVFALIVLASAGPQLARAIGKHGSDPRWIYRFASSMALPMASMGRRRLRLVLLISLLTWISLFASFVVLGRATLGQVDAFQIVSAGAAASIAFAIPASAIANVGPFQAAWVWTLKAFGFALTPALACALVVQGTIVVVSTFVGFVGYTMIEFKATRSQ